MPKIMVTTSKGVILIWSNEDIPLDLLQLTAGVPIPAMAFLNEKASNSSSSIIRPSITSRNELLSSLCKSSSKFLPNMDLKQVFNCCLWARDLLLIICIIVFSSVPRPFIAFLSLSQSFEQSKSGQSVTVGVSSTSGSSTCSITCGSSSTASSNTLCEGSLINNNNNLP
ncbi:hypothetical protein BpHYR1_016774 [Brachionus plicatilis]|uniref:Uncharacterized protein n=1 Tax=Brachionus plicatilis TaxID=10195 RepID=A0A3M7PNI3_BRAPC|nr:hypothetical protein BpHYR1_016774 [Brachionus plicatilis]